MWRELLQQSSVGYTDQLSSVWYKVVEKSEKLLVYFAYYYL